MLVILQTVIEKKFELKVNFELPMFELTVLGL